MGKYFVVGCWVSCYGENTDYAIEKVFTDKVEAEKFCAEKNKTASRAKEYEENYTVQEVEQ